MKKEFFATEKEGKIVEFMAVFGRHAPIAPTLSTALTCSECKGADHYAPYAFSSADHGHGKNVRRVWICANAQCPTMQMKNIPSTYDPTKYDNKY